MTTPEIKTQKFFRSITVPGLYSLQCVAMSSGTPDVTVYRSSLDELVGGSADSEMSRMIKQKRFSYFVLQHSKDRADYYDRAGDLIESASRRPEPYHSEMAPQSYRCDNASLVNQITWLLPTPTICGAFEAHNGQAAVGRANFYTMLDLLINRATKDKERQHIYLLSHHLPCPRSVLVADMSLVSESAQGIFLDCYRRIKNGWPINQEHHKTELARTLATCRYNELRRWLRMVRAARELPDDMDRYELVLNSIALNTKFHLAKIFVGRIYPKFRLMEQGCEHITDQDVLSSANPVGLAVDAFLAQTPISKS